MKNKNKAIELSREEYVFLCEKFEIMSQSDLEKLPSYIVSTRKNNFEKVLKIAIENELSDTEKLYINEKYFNQLSVFEISKKYNTNRQSVYRILKRASDKLFTSLKYLYYCGFTLLNPPENLDEIIKSTQGGISK